MTSWRDDGLAASVLAPDGTWSTAADRPAWDGACWYVFADPQAELNPRLADLLRQHGAERPDVDIVYGDEVIAGAPGRLRQHLCKPAFDETQLIAQDYIGLPVAVQGRAMTVLGGLDASAGSAQVYEMLLRAVAAGLKIGRITQVLAINRPDAVRATAADRLAVLRRTGHSRAGCDAAPGLTASSVELRRRFDDPPPVTILVLPGRPAPDRAVLGSGLLRSLCQTDWPMDRLQVMVASDKVAGMEPWPFGVRHLALAGRAAGANQLWQTSGAEHLVFLDAGLSVRHPGWLRALMTFAVDEDVGGVGARLLQPDGAIRHAGMPCGAPGPYAFAGLPADAPSYQDWACVQREWSLVSGEAFATRRSLLEQVNGLDERFGYGIGQADLCLRMRLLGLRIVYTPHAELMQRDGASYDSGNSEPDETALFLEKWQHFAAADPAYHPRLTRNAAAITPVPSDDDWWRQRPSSRRSKPFDAEGGGGPGGVQPE